MDENIYLDVVRGLNVMLQLQRERAEASEEREYVRCRELADADDNVRRLSAELEVAKTNLKFAENNRRLYNDPSTNRANLFDAFLSYPEGMMACITWLRANHEMCRSNKISAIKQVRDLGRLGLKQAKDLVEVYAAEYCGYVAGNPCKDSSLLNG